MTDIEKQKAEAEIAKWFWQPAEGHNFRYRYAVRTLTRFYEMVTPAADTLRLILEYLRDQEISGTISLLGKSVDLGEGWKAKDVWYQTAAGDQFANTKQDRVRVFQTLMLAPDSGEGDGPYTVEDGCQYAIEHTFYWSVDELPTLPSSSSGVQYTMQGVTRDSETGLFSCVIEMRERVQQDVALYDTAKTIFETAQEEQHLGVKAADVPTTGQAASVANGVLVKRQLRKNPDCTTDVINEVTEEEPVSNAVVKVEKTWEGIVRTTQNRNQANPAAEPETMKPGSSITNERTPGGLYNQTVVEADETPLGVKARDCDKTIFEHRDSVTSNVPDDPGEQHGSAADGTIIQKSAAMTRFGTWDVKQITLVEIPVSDSVKQYRKTLRGTVETTIDRNQEDPLDDGTGTGGTPMKVGETRRSEKTPGGFYNNTTEAVTTEAAGEIAKDCQKTIFEHTDETVTNQISEPTDKEASAAGSGKTYRKMTRKNDEGTFDVTERETTELGATGAVKQYRKTLRGTVETTIDRNQTTPLNGTNLAVGETRRSEKTPGGLYNNTTEAVTTEAAGKVLDGKDVETVKSSAFSTTNQTTNPGTITLTADVNKSKRKISRKNDLGTFDVEEQETDYTPVQTSKTWTDERGTHIYCSYRNQPQPLTPTAAEGSSFDQTTASFSENDHGSFDGSYTAFTAKEPSESGKTLQYETEADVETKFYYMKAGGEMVYREISGTFHLAYGKAHHIMSEVKDAEECALVGWRTRIGDGPGVVSATWYTDISIGYETKVTA